MTPLRQRFIDDLRVRNFSPKTVKAYEAGFLRFARHFGRSPADLGSEEIRSRKSPSRPRIRCLTRGSVRNGLLTGWGVLIREIESLARFFRVRSRMSTFPFGLSFNDLEPESFASPAELT